MVKLGKNRPLYQQRTASQLAIDVRHALSTAMRGVAWEYLPPDSRRWATSRRWKRKQR